MHFSVGKSVSAHGTATNKLVNTNVILIRTVGSSDGNLRLSSQRSSRRAESDSLLYSFHENASGNVAGGMMPLLGMRWWGGGGLDAGRLGGKL